jgi:hypothetical protein
MSGISPAERFSGCTCDFMYDGTDASAQPQSWSVFEKNSRRPDGVGLEA